MNFYKFLVIFCIVIASQTILSQSETNIDRLDSISDEAEDEVENEAKFYVQSGNNIVQVGQAMANNELYIRPGVTYYHKTGLYAGGSVTMMPTDKQRPIDNYYLNLGYDLDLGSNFSTGIDYSFSHYYSTKQISSSAGHMIRPYISWDNAYVTPTLTPIILLGTTQDYAMQLDLTHVFIFKSVFTDRDKFSIPISFGALGGTSEYYTTYNVVNKKGKPITSVTSTSSKLALTSIYSMITVKYKLNKTSLSLNTSYYHSTDPNNVSTTSNTPIYKLTLAYYL